MGYIVLHSGVLDYGFSYNLLTLRIMNPKRRYILGANINREAWKNFINGWIGRQEIYS